MPLIEKPFARAASNARSSTWAKSSTFKSLSVTEFIQSLNNQVKGCQNELTERGMHKHDGHYISIYYIAWWIPSFCGGGEIVFYKTNFPLNKIGFVICDKCNEEFYAPKVNFSDECFAILALIMIKKILKIMFCTQTQSYGPPAGGESLEERRMREVIISN